MSGFQFFEGTTTESAAAARITVRKGGILVLTRAAVEMLGDDVAAVQVGYNPETRAVALRPAEADAQGAYRLRDQRNSISKLVDGKRVFKHHGLTADSSSSYDAEDFGDGLIGFTLPEGVVVAAAIDAPAATEPESESKATGTAKPTAKRRSSKVTKS